MSRGGWGECMWQQIKCQKECGEFLYSRRSLTVYTRITFFWQRLYYITTLACFLTLYLGITHIVQSLSLSTPLLENPSWILGSSVVWLTFVSDKDGWYFNKYSIRSPSTRCPPRRPAPALTPEESQPPDCLRYRTPGHWAAAHIAKKKTLLSVAFLTGSLHKAE